MIIITVFPWQFLIITQSYRYNTEYYIVLLKNRRSSHWRCSVKEPIHKKLRQFQRKTPVLESFLNKAAGSQACSFIKKRLQHRCFPVKLAKFLRTSIVKTVCELLVPKISTLQKKLFIDLFYKIMTFIIIAITFEALSFFCPFVQLLLICFIKIFVPPFFVNFILLN